MNKIMQISQFCVTLHKSSCHTCNEAWYLKNTIPRVQLVHSSLFVSADTKIKNHGLSPLLLPHPPNKKKSSQVGNILFQSAPSLTGELI